MVKNKKAPTDTGSA